MVHNDPELPNIYYNGSLWTDSDDVAFICGEVFLHDPSGVYSESIYPNADVLKHQGKKIIAVSVTRSGAAYTIEQSLFCPRREPFRGAWKEIKYKATKGFRELRYIEE